ncbi:MAG: phosphoribosylformylglycinamidine cyclo-ligase [Armatimonadetes bacterium]|nr:phosphoribosylformylglycinamidine cyclo-ligase [Armatimonadota bacterium]
MTRGASYRDAGVDLEAAEESVRMIRDAVRSTHDARVLSELAEFGGLFALGSAYRDPVLVAGTDGVGTKLKVAFALDRHDTVGQDLVAMCVDDIVCQGARPLFFLDYLAMGKLRPGQVAEIVGGVAKACKMAGCALLGGETAELPGFYAPGEYDLAGFAVGVVERNAVITGTSIGAGCVILGLTSTGLHSNGYSLARMVLLEKAGLKLDAVIPELGRTLGEELLQPTAIYAPHLVAALDAGIPISGLAHITGGGIPGNLQRVVPDGFVARLSRAAIPGGPIFSLVQRLGQVEDAEMLRTFNMGIGMIAVVPPAATDAFTQFMDGRGQKVVPLGEIVKAEGDKVQIL